MKRKISSQLNQWAQKSDRKPLIIKGVRQSGKTTVLKRFGRERFRQCHYINFEKHAHMYAAFEKDLDPKMLLNELSFRLNTSIDIEHDLLIFDEIQACPRALTSLKYFNEDCPHMAICAAGSLLGIHLNDASFPVGNKAVTWLSTLSYPALLFILGNQSI